MNDYQNKGCPQDKELVEAVTRGLDPKRKKKLSLHLEKCGLCRRKFLLLIELRDHLRSSLADNQLSPEEFERLKKMAWPQLAPLPGQRTFRRARKRPTGFPWFGVAVLGLIFVSAGIWFFWLRPPEPILRDSTTSHLRLLEPVGKIAGQPAEFRWETIKGAKSYDFLLIDENLKLLYAQRTTAPLLSLPEAQRQKIKRKEKYIWVVEALDETEQKIASASGFFWVE